MKIQNIAWIVLILLISTYCKNRQPDGAIDSVDEKEIKLIPDSAIWVSVDTSNSVATWIGSKPNGKHNGIIPVKDGKIAYSNDTLFGGEFTLNISELKVMDMSTEPDRQEKLKNHLLNEDFFEADSFPTAHFEITGIVPYDSTLLPQQKSEFESDFKPASFSSFIVKNPNYWVSGNLTIKSITKNISFPANINFNYGFKAEAKFNIDRTDWNINYHDESGVLDKLKDRFIYNTVNVGIYLEAKTNQTSGKD